MIDLTKQSGLPIALEESTGKIFSSSIETIIPKEGKRTFDQIREVIENKKAAFTGDYVYLVYRGISKRSDAERIIQSSLRYNLIVIPPGTIDGEFLKTLGHFHSKKPSTNVSYSEIYEILYGEAIFIIQKMDDGYQEVTENYIIPAKVGDKVIIPPDFGHMTINPMPNETLVMSNLMTTQNNPNYEPYRNFCGASHKLVSIGDGKVQIIKNQNYVKVPDIVKLKPKEIPGFSVSFAKPLYQSFIDNPNAFAFLGSPEAFEKELAVDSLFTRE
jgi:glucose-6-phosphate isomerase